MLMDHTENTFTAPVFDGSTSLRNAAGEMIESVTKETKRKKAVVSSAYIDKLYTDVSSLYKLDMIDDSQYSDVPTSSGGENGGGGSVDKRPLPTMSVVLLCSLGAIWLAMGAYVAVGAVKKHRISKNKEKDVK